MSMISYFHIFTQIFRLSLLDFRNCKHQLEPYIQKQNITHSVVIEWLEFNSVQSVNCCAVDFNHCNPLFLDSLFIHSPHVFHPPISFECVVWNWCLDVLAVVVGIHECTEQTCAYNKNYLLTLIGLSCLASKKGFLIIITNLSEGLPFWTNNSICVCIYIINIHISPFKSYNILSSTIAIQLPM